jgi:hypothetical protein
MSGKTRTVLTSVVTWGTLASTALTGVVAELRVTDTLPDNWTGPVIAIAAPLAGVLAVSVAVIRRVMPVSKEERGLD